MMYSYMNPDIKARAAGLMAAVASTMLNRTNTLVNEFGTPIMFHHGYGYGDGNGIGIDPVSVESYPGSGYIDPITFPRTGYTDPRMGYTKDQSEHLNEEEIKLNNGAAKLNNGEQVTPAAFRRTWTESYM